VLVICLLVGMALRTSLGRASRTRIENSLLQKIPGYGVFQSMTRQMAGDSRENAWKPALADIEDALVPAFTVEELDDGRFNVFVPSVPTPLAGAIYILTAARVHPVDVPFTQAVKVITRWGSQGTGRRYARKSNTVTRPEVTLLIGSSVVFTEGLAANTTLAMRLSGPRSRT
jgi:uncharacterized membrane protein